MKVYIPVLQPKEEAEGDYTVCSQPIMQLKELRVDQVRYDQWRNHLRRVALRKAVNVDGGEEKR